ncbi:MAG: aldehyde dehydrogenase family protein [Oceanospirillaceae bacterium]|nr:aldehyde dehydrogenase family protein [Oceanospirillaceae bacterium]
MPDSKHFYIDGAWVAPCIDHDLEVINPSTEQVIEVISLGSASDVDKAVAAAKAAFVSWSQTSRDERIGFIEGLLDIYRTRNDALGELISQEMGCPIDKSISAQAGAGSWQAEGILEELKTFVFESSFSEASPDTYMLHEPIGVCALITPWNWPMNQVVVKVVAALAAGCTMVLKPSEIAPLSSLMFAQMIHDAGIPAGVFNLVNGDGIGVGTALTGHSDVDMVSFTGSTRAGVAISKNAADTVKRVSLELGGKGANIVFADAGEKAIIKGVRSLLSNSGQSCNAPSRMLVERSIYAQAVAQATAEFARTEVGLASESGRHLGPVVSEQQYNKIQGLIQVAIDEGAHLAVGGTGKPEGFEQGYYVKPTLFTDVNNAMTIAREEVFGPVLVMMPFDTEAEAIAITNDTDYGLTNYVQTTDGAKANRVARQLRSGMVEINSTERAGGTPFGGYKQSGNGREGGLLGLMEFLEVKCISGWHID